ncbi:MAG: hypothetical protein QW783_03425 [Candidatus Micrarchaeia archaeon]
MINDTPSLISFALQAAFYLPSLIWNLRKINEIKSNRFWYLNRNKEPLKEQYRAKIQKILYL